jgi:hypothetical protein
MNPDVYQFDIARADLAADLHVLHADITADDTLTMDEKQELLAQIALAFGRRNARANANRKSRW